MMSYEKKSRGLAVTPILLVLLIAALVGAIYFMLNSAPSANDGAVTTTSDQLPDNSFSINAVRVFDGQQVLENQTVLVRDGLIAAVGQALEIPADLQSIDGAGKTLLPGLIDSHVHLFGTARQDALRFGVTTAIDLFSDQSKLSDYRASREQLGQQNVADIYSAGSLITAPGGHGTQFGIPIPTLSNAADADAFVAARQAEGSDFIKVVYENGSEYDGSIATLDRATLQAVLAAARQRGLLSIVHVSTLEFAKHALQAGADGLAHVFSDLTADQELLDLARQHNAFVIATLAVQASVAGQSQIDRWLALPAVDQQLSQVQRNSLSSAFPNAYPDVIDTALRSVASLHAAGVRILAGSDAPNPGTAHGIGLHQELWWLTRAGLSPQQALRAATADVADVFGLSDRGRIAAGLRADMVLVEGNPLNDIDATVNIAGVWKNGYRIVRTNQLAAPVQTAAAEKYAANLLADFESNDIGDSQSGWQVTTDQMLGGQSEAVLEKRVEELSGNNAGDNANGYLHVSGQIRSGSMFPWAGAITFVAPEPMAPVDASDIKVLRFRARGQPGDYQLMVFSGGQDNTMPALQQITLGSDWQTHEIDLNKVGGVELKRLKAFAWVAGSGHSEFVFDLDEVELQ